MIIKLLETSWTRFLKKNNPYQNYLTAVAFFFCYTYYYQLRTSTVICVLCNMADLLFRAPPGFRPWFFRALGSALPQLANFMTPEPKTGQKTRAVHEAKKTEGNPQHRRTRVPTQLIHTRGELHEVGADALGNRNAIIDSLFARYFVSSKVQQ